jgi:hypothetical protein
LSTSATDKKRKDLIYTVKHLLEPHNEVEGVVAVGSIASGNARIESDIDIIIFMSPINHYIVPAESIWCPWDDSFHSIFIDDDKIQANGIHLDVTLRDLAKWSDPSFHWPEYDRAGLADGWIAFDRRGQIKFLIDSRTKYDDNARISRLDEFILTIDNEIYTKNLEELWKRYGPFICFGRLEAVYDSIVGGLFAYNRKWRFHRNRESEFLCRLAWLPQNYQARILHTNNGVKNDLKAYLHRANAMQEIATEIIVALQKEKLYGVDPAAEAFKRSHADPGRAWNMDEWNQKRVK